MAFSGRLSFNPVTDTLTLPNGELFRFSPPSGRDLPTAGFSPGEVAYYPLAMPEPQPDAEVVIKPDSQRLELLEPFSSHFNDESLELPKMKVLMRVRGKCTTDHISAAVRMVGAFWTTFLISRDSTGPVAEVQRSFDKYFGKSMYVIQ